MAQLPVVQQVRVVDAPVQEVFELLARPDRHHVFDGSGTVRRPLPGSPERLSAGARFGMRMRWGLPYSMTNTVVEFTEPTATRRGLISWQHFGGHIWRWIVEPLDRDRCKVTEQWDPRGARSQAVLELMGWPRRAPEWVRGSLDRLEAWARERK